jgi:hypothetical protein
MPPAESQQSGANRRPPPAAAAVGAVSSSDRPQLPASGYPSIPNHLIDISPACALAAARAGRRRSLLRATPQAPATSPSCCSRRRAASTTRTFWSRQARSAVQCRARHSLPASYTAGCFARQTLSPCCLPRLACCPSQRRPACTHPLSRSGIHPHLPPLPAAGAAGLPRQGRHPAVRDLRRRHPRHLGRHRHL